MNPHTNPKLTQISLYGIHSQKVYPYTEVSFQTDKLTKAQDSYDTAKVAPVASSLTS